MTAVVVVFSEEGDKEVQGKDGYESIGNFERYKGEEEEEEEEEERFEKKEGFDKDEYASIQMSVTQEEILLVPNVVEPGKEKEERVVMRVMMRREGQIPCVIIAWRDNLPLSQTCRDNLPL